MKRKLWYLGVIAPIAILPLTTISCSKDSVAIKTNGYADAMTKLAGKDINLLGCWGDARFYAGENAKDIIVVGTTSAISNDGAQARADLKADDVKGVQDMFILAMQEANNQAKEAKKLKSLEEYDKLPADKKSLLFKAEMKDGKLKVRTVFDIYSHSDYTKVSPDAEITVNAKGKTKKAFNSALVAGGDYFDESGKFKADAKALKIYLIPSSDASDIAEAGKKIKDFLATKGYKTEITVSTGYDPAATALENKSIDVAFLPVGTWDKTAPSTNFIIQAGRPVQIIDPYKNGNSSVPAINDEKILVEAFNNYKEFNGGSLYVQKEKAKRPNAVTEGYSKELKEAVDAIDEGDLHVAGYYRSYIYARKDSEIAQIILEALKEHGSNWKLKWDDVKDKIKYGHTGTTSSASYSFPEVWFAKHFEGFTSFN